MVTTTDSILRESPVARTPVSRPLPGMKYEHLNHGLVEVKTVEDGMVVFTRPGPTDKAGYINRRQQPLAQFRAQTVDVS